MIGIANRPILEYIIESVREAGIEEIVLVVGYKRNRIQTYFGDGDDWGVDVRYVVQDKQLGTAHAVAQAEPYIESPFLVLNGDCIIDAAAVTGVQESITGGGSPHALAVTRVERPELYSGITTAGGQVRTIKTDSQQESDTELVNAGIYGFSPDVFETIRDTEQSGSGEYELPSTITRLIATDGVQAVPYDGAWHDVSNLWDLLPITDIVLDRIDDRVSGTVADGARLDTRSVLAPTASVGQSAVIGANSTVGANAHVEPNATIKNSVVFPDASIEAGAVVKDSIIGAGATIGANTTIRGGISTVTIRETIHNDVRLGAVVGDNTELGGGVVLSTGTIVGNAATIGEGCTVSGRIGDGETVRRG